MKNDFVTVLDLGSTRATCLTAGFDSKGDVKVEAVVSVPCKGMRRGVLSDLDEASRCIDAAVRRLQQEIGQEISSLIVAVSGSHVEGLNTQGFKPIIPRSRLITHQDVLEVLNHSKQQVLPPDREQIQVLPREFRVDGTRDVKKPIGMSGAKLEVLSYIVTGQTTALQNLEKAVEMTGKRVEQMVLSPLAAGIGVLSQEEMDLGVVVVDIGGGTTDMAIFAKGSILHSASIPVGSGHITSDLINLLRTSPEEAERLKVACGSAFARLVDDRDSIEVMQLGQTQARPMQRKVMCEIIEARAREIARMVSQQIEKSGMMGLLPGGVVITGGGARLQHIDKLFEDQLKHMRARVAEPALPARFGKESGYAVSVGAARFALQCYDEIAPASGGTAWKDRVKSLFSMLSGR